MSNNQIEVRNNTATHRYEVALDGQLAVLTYSQRGNQIAFLHTGVPEELEGHGIANALAHTALEDARANHHMVVPACPFVATYIRRHPEYLSLLSDTEKARLQQR